MKFDCESALKGMFAFTSPLSTGLPSGDAMRFACFVYFEPENVRQGKASATEGPFAETKEHLVGFILIEAVDVNEALEIAAGVPLAKLGSIEVRPVMRMSP